MIYKVDIDYFVDGYSVKTGGSCVDLPIAIICGNFIEDNYYKFLTIQTTRKNWGSFDTENGMETMKNLIRDLGLELNDHFYPTWQNTLAAIQENTKSGYPVLMPASYHKLFYYLEYNKKAPHMSIISGYDDERGLLFIVDCNFVKHNLTLHNKDYTLYEIPLTNKIYEEIWQESHDFLFESNKNLGYHFFTISKSDSSLPISYQHLLKKILLIYQKGENQLIKVIKNFEEWTNNEDNEEIILGFRRDFYGQLKVFFDTLKKSVGTNTRKIQLIDEFYDSYLKNREMIISRLIATILGSKKLDKTKQVDYINRISHYDNELFELISYIIDTQK